MGKTLNTYKKKTLRAKIKIKDSRALILLLSLAFGPGPLHSLPSALLFPFSFNPISKIKEREERKRDEGDMRVKGKGQDKA